MSIHGAAPFCAEHLDDPPGPDRIEQFSSAVSKRPCTMEDRARPPRGSVSTYAA
jgi:hypothetical protein